MPGPLGRKPVVCRLALLDNILKNGSMGLAEALHRVVNSPWKIGLDQMIEVGYGSEMRSSMTGSSWGPSNWRHFWDPTMGQGPKNDCRKGSGSCLHWEAEKMPSGSDVSIGRDCDWSIQGLEWLPTMQMMENSRSPPGRFMVASDDFDCLCPEGILPTSNAAPFVAQRGHCHL